MLPGLAIETSGRLGSVAITEDGQVLAEDMFEHGLKHAAEMVPRIDALLKTRNWRPADIREIYVSVGPGSFTGLRIGITLAKTLAFATGARMVAVPTVEVLAHNASVEARDVVILLDAKRDQIFTARLHRASNVGSAPRTELPDPEVTVRSADPTTTGSATDRVAVGPKVHSEAGGPTTAPQRVAVGPTVHSDPGGPSVQPLRGAEYRDTGQDFREWTVIEPAHLDSLTEMLNRSPRPVYLIGEGIPFHEKFLPKDDPGVIVAPVETWRARAAVVAALGHRMARQGSFIDPQALVPCYIRKPEAEEKYEQMHPK